MRKELNMFVTKAGKGERNVSTLFSFVVAADSSDFADFERLRADRAPSQSIRCTHYRATICDAAAQSFLVSEPNLRRWSKMMMARARITGISPTKKTKGKQQ